MFTLEITRQASLLNNINLTESFDIDLLKRLIQSNVLIEVDYKLDANIDSIVSYKTERDHLLKFLACSDRNEGEVLVPYKYSKKAKDYGRVYPKKSLSLGSFRRSVRHTISNNAYVDIDIVNAHPTILYQLMESLNLPSTSLKSYVLDRDVRIKEVIEQYGVDRDTAKNLFIRLMYGGVFSKWKKDNDIPANKTISQFILDFSTELSAVGLKVITEPKNAAILNTIVAKKNKGGTMLSFLCQNIERKILEYVYLYLLNNKFIHDNKGSLNCVLCFDGLMILKTDKVTDELLVNLNTEIKNKTKLDLKFTYKSMDEGYPHEELPVLLPTVNPNLFEFTCTDVFDEGYLLSLDGYPLRKKYFEMFACKMLSSNCYMIKHDLVDIKAPFVYYPCRDKSLLESFSSIFEFLCAWIKDPKIRKFVRMDCIPYNGVYTPNKDGRVFNLFKGYNPLIKTPYNKGDSKQILKAFMEIAFNLCEANEDNLEYFLNFIAQIVQFPADKSVGQFIVIRGCQGNGKTIICNTIGNMLGKDHYISTPKVTDLFGDHATGRLGKLLVNWNEAVNNNSIYDQLKSAVTEDTATINPKCIQQSEVSMFDRIIITTNNTSAVKIEPSDRRTVVFQATDKFADMENYREFWNDRVVQFKDPEFIACLYDFFNERDISGYDFKNKRPITELYNEWASLHMSKELTFLVHYMNELKQIKPTIHNKTKGTVLYRVYCDYCIETGLSNIGTNIAQKTFYAKFQEFRLDSIKRTTDNGSISFGFTPNDLYAELVKKKMIPGNSDEFAFVEPKQDGEERRKKIASKYAYHKKE